MNTAQGSPPLSSPVEDQRSGGPVDGIAPGPNEAPSTKALDTYNQRLAEARSVGIQVEPAFSPLPDGITVGELRLLYTMLGAQIGEAQAAAKEARP